MTIQEWREVQVKKGSPRYAHFDKRIPLNKCFAEFTDPSRVKIHSFYPFIHYTIKNRKVKNGKKQEPKKREIYYAAHRDGWIYRYYGHLLNECYNKRVIEDGIDHVSVAYRTNHESKNNIDYALEAFKFIQRHDSCYIMLGDFTSFFDNLSHSYLKERLCDLLDVETLPEDYYAVFKNVTRFSYVEMDSILEYYDLPKSKAGMRELNQKDRLMTPEQLRGFKEHIHLNPNLVEKRGVPQGSPMSAVLANVYMLDVDKRLASHAADMNGFYMRYSDDFIMIIPGVEASAFQRIFETVQGIVASAGGIELKEEKTKMFYYQNQSVKNCTAEIMQGQHAGKNVVEFLGFAFDGVKIRLRDKTISKYYNKTYRKAQTIADMGGFTPKGNRASGKNLYSRYSIKGSSYYRKAQGKNVGNSYSERNFLDYVHSARCKMGDAFVDTITPRHMQRIRKAISAKKT